MKFIKAASPVAPPVTVVHYDTTFDVLSDGRAIFLLAEDGSRKEFPSAEAARAFALKPAEEPAVVPSTEPTPPQAH